MKFCIYYLLLSTVAFADERVPKATQRDPLPAFWSAEREYNEAVDAAGRRLLTHLATLIGHADELELFIVTTTKSDNELFSPDLAGVPTYILQRKSFDRKALEGLLPALQTALRRARSNITSHEPIHAVRLWRIERDGARETKTQLMESTFGWKHANFSVRLGRRATAFAFPDLALRDLCSKLLAIPEELAAEARN